MPMTFSEYLKATNVCHVCGLELDEDSFNSFLCSLLCNRLLEIALAEDLERDEKMPHLLLYATVTI